MLQGTKEIIRLYDNDEFKPFIIIGGHGLGKSSYATSLISDVYGHVFNHGVPYWETFTPLVQEWFEAHIGFHPREVIDEWELTDKREQCFFRSLDLILGRFLIVGNMRMGSGIIVIVGMMLVCG